MSYTRDPDRATRGVGAIAAADHSRARQQQRVQVGRATRQRDRAMAAVTRGALGATAQYNTTSGYSRQVPLRATPVSHPSTIPPPAAGSGGMYIPPSGPIATVPPPMATLPPGPVATVPPPITPLPPISAPPASSSSGSSGSGSPATSTTSSSSGSSGSTSTGVVLTNPGGTPIAPLEPLPEDGGDLSAASPDNTVRNVLLIGGAAAAAYFLFFRKKGTP